MGLCPEYDAKGNEIPCDPGHDIVKAIGSNPVLVEGEKAAKAVSVVALSVPMAAETVPVAGLAIGRVAEEAPEAVSAGGRLVRALVGHSYPEKIGAGGRLQPYNPANGQYVSRAANPGLLGSPLAHFAAGLSQGFAAGVTMGELDMPASVSGAQSAGQWLGRAAGMLISNWPK